MSEEHVKAVAGLVIGQRRDGKRYYSEQAKRLLVAQCLRPGASVSAIALANNMNANVLRKWMAKPELLRHSADTDTVLLPVSIDAPSPAATEVATTCASGTIQIDLRARQLRFDGAVDLDVFRVALEVLAAR